MPLLKFAKNYLVAAAGSAYAFTAGVTQFRHRSFIRDVARRFGHDDSPRGTLPVVPIDRLTSPATPVVMAATDVVDGNVSLLELLVLNRLVRERRPGAIFEIGTFDGRTTLNLAENAPDARVYTLDLPRGAATKIDLSADDRAYVEKDASGTRFAGTSAAARITQLYGDSATFDFSAYPCDFVFVDGAHSYEYVLSDTESAFRMLSGGKGTIVWHDYTTWEGVTRALSDLRSRDRRLGNMVNVEGTTLAVLEVS
jgi:predicted O-methyltransferase YrrM